MGLITLQRDIPQQKDHWFFCTANRHEDTKSSAYTSRTGKSNWFFMCSSIKKLLVAFHVCCYLVSGCVPMYGQYEKIDSLKALLANSIPDSTRATLLFEIGFEYMQIRDDSAALSYLGETVQMGRSLGMRRSVAKALRYMGSNYNDMRRPADAARCATEAMTIYEELRDTIEITKVLIVIGESEAHLGNMKAAEEYLLSSLTLAGKTGNIDAIQNSTQFLAKYYRLTRRYEESLTYHLKSLELAKQLNMPKRLAGVYYSLSPLYQYMGKNEKAREACASALELYKEINHYDGIALCYNMMGLILEKPGTYEEALRYYTLYLEMKEKTGEHKGMSIAYRNMARTYTAMNRHDEAAQMHQMRLQLAMQNQDTSLLISIYGEAGMMHLNTGNHTEALRNYLTASELAKHLNTSPDMSSTYTNLGHVYFKHRNFDKSLEYYRAAHQARDHGTDMHGSARSYYNLCHVYQNMDSLDQALHTCEKSMELMRQFGSDGDVARVNNLLGSIYSRLGQHTKARILLDSALQTAEKIGPEECMFLYNNMGDLLIRMADADGPQTALLRIQEAKTNYEKALSVAHDFKRPDAMIESYRGLSDAYRREGDFLKSIEFLSKYTVLKDSILNNETTRQLEQLRTQYEVEKAVSAEKANQDLLLSAQRFQSEKELAERNAQHQLELTEEAARKEKAIAIEKLKYRFALAQAKTRQDLLLSEQKFLSERELAEEAARHEMTMAEEKARQQRKEAEAKAEAEAEQADRKRKSEIFLTLAGLVGIIAIFITLLLRQRNHKRRAIEKAESAHKMAELELQSLRAQLNPHFMFNSLNAIQELILMEENDKSHTYLARFAKLLRMLLENANSPFIPLSKELEFLELYLCLENLRIPDLKYKINVDPGIDIAHTRIPNMILQPYIENAIWHGLSHKKDGDRAILIRVHRAVDGIRYEIEDNGVGRKRAAELKSDYRKNHKSKGMELLTKRFRLLSEEYRSHIETQVIDLERNNMAAGTRVVITVPWELAKDIKKTA